MARIRTIKPEFFTSEDIVSLGSFARLLYVALWCEADREGRMYWKPKTFKLRYFPADDVDIQALCDELIVRGLVRLYGDGLAYIPTFLQHQHINPRESASTITAPGTDASGTRDPRVSNACARDSDVQGGRERKGKEGASPTRPGFDRFWQAYPKKASKGQAEKVWQKLSPDEQLTEQILQAVERAKTRADWQKQEGQFIPYPATWLNAKGWEDSPKIELPKLALQVAV